jgi:two-component system sensor histidine kinase DesK
MADALLAGAESIGGGEQAGPDGAHPGDSGYALPPFPRSTAPRSGRRPPLVTAAPARSRAGHAPPGPAAPADPAIPGAGQPPAVVRRATWLFAVIWLVYLVQPASSVWADPDPVRRYLGLATLAVFAAVFTAAFATARSRRRREQGRSLDQALPGRIDAVAVAAAAALTGAGYVTLGHMASGLLIYVAVMGVFLLPSRAGWAVVVAALAVSVAVPAIAGWPVDGSTTFQIGVSALAAWGVAHVIKRNAQLAAAHEEITRLALAGERNRFARDLHDILGHSLTVVAVKAELAGRLASLDPARAATEIADVERIARQALADVRAAAAGYREVTLAGELASARTALSAAGIEADLPGADLPPMPGPRQELFGWAVREGVTNVIRHSGAVRCRITLTASQIDIADDGRGPAAPAAAPGHDSADAFPGTGRPGGCAGHGLAGLCERAAAVGAEVSAGPSAWGGFSLLVRDRAGRP